MVLQKIHAEKKLAAKMAEAIKKLNLKVTDRQGEKPFMADIF